MHSRERLTILGAVWLLGSWFVGFACFDSGGSAPDASSDAATDVCQAPLGCDEIETLDPYGDAAIGLRARALFAQSCSNAEGPLCHTSMPPAGTTDLAVNPDSVDYDAYGLINIPSIEEPSVLRVVPFHPETSYLYWKVSSNPAIEGVVMPASTEMVDPQIAELVEEWIEAGAP